MAVGIGGVADVVLAGMLMCTAASILVTSIVGQASSSVVLLACFVWLLCTGGVGLFVAAGMYVCSVLTWLLVGMSMASFGYVLLSTVLVWGSV